MENLIEGSIHPKNGLIEKLSKHSVAETLNRLEKLIKAKGLRIFARIDHAGAAKSVGLEMLPTEVLIFGDPATGTPLMHRYPLLAIDLPLKVLVWENTNGQVHLAYNSPLYLQKRFSIEETPFQGIDSLIEMAAEQT